MQIPTISSVPAPLDGEFPLSGDTGAPGKSQSWKIPSLSPSELCPFVVSPSGQSLGWTEGFLWRICSQPPSPKAELLYALPFPNIPFFPSITPTPGRWNSYITQQKAPDKFQPDWALLRGEQRAAQPWGLQPFLLPSGFGG